MSFSFNGTTKVITLSAGTTAVTVKDLYDAWKDWVLAGHAGYLQALRVVGGDPTVAGQYLGSTFFLINGWKIKPQEANHTLVVTGNIFADDGSSPFIATTGGYNVLVQVNVSNLVDTVATGGSTAPTAAQNAAAIMSYAVEGSVTFQNAIRMMSAVLYGKCTISGSTVTFRDINDSSNIVVITADSSGQRITASQYP